MKISKEQSGVFPAAAGEELAAINRYARRELTPEEVYTFTVKLCDNEVDRDFERFSDSCLDELAELFVGKSGLLDHAWTAAGQLARIYRTEVLTDKNRLNAAGEPYRYLKGWAYMLRSGETEPFIQAIDAGIVRETSVGCAVAEKKCSICGESACAHVPGQEYGGRLCHRVLSGAADAYEWSFVAVPAQREAGVMKCAKLRELVDTARSGDMKSELERLEKLAGAGQALLDRERAEVYRLSLLWDEGMAPAMKAAAKSMDAHELMSLRGELEKKLEKSFPPLCQLPGKNSEVRFDGDDYLI
ncbi:MAG: hypothetical protein ACOX81_02435 [Candidatus Heteroscillospira sp.]|jgi:hypothetical protein